MELEKYWSEILQVLTEDENGRIRKTDMDALLKTDVVDFVRNLKFFEKRMEERLQQLNNLKYGKSTS